MDRYIGKKIDGRYEIREIVGIGGMSYVYKGYDSVEDRIVAIKILKDEFAASEEFLRRFKNESKAIAMLSHPNIVKVYDVHFSERAYSIVMEYIDGITLKEYIDKTGAIQWKDAILFTEQILNALRHAHSKGIVHRDIKPQNIMLLPNGTVKMMDFGIARFARSEMNTVTDKAIGSVHYISPEQARGEQADQKSDLYSVGVMMFEMLTGQLPFQAESPVSVAIKQISTKPMNPRQINPEIPEGLEEIILKAMSKDLTQRYQTSDEMLADMEEFKRNPSIHFQYKYFIDDSPTKFMDIIKKAQDEKGAIEMKKQTKKSLPVIPILSGIALSCVVVTLSFLLWMFLSGGFSNSKTIIMEDILGKTIEQVKADPKFENALFEEIGQENSAYAAGTICYQDPAAGRSIKTTTTIKYKISKGTKKITVPEIVNNDIKSAKQLLDSLGIKYRVDYEKSDTVALDYVISVAPGMGEEIDSTATLVVRVSSGRATTTTTVPNLKGLKQSSAEAEIQRAGLKVGVITTKDSTTPAGYVLSQTPASGSTVSIDSAVDLVISTGKYDRDIDVSIKLPSTDTSTVNLKALLDGATVEQTNLQPSVAKFWNITVTGQGSTKKTLTIYYNNSPYQTYEIIFDSGSCYLTIDYSSEFPKTSGGSSGS